MPNNCQSNGTRGFEFARDTFAFPNQTHWNYHFDDAAGKTTFTKADPTPSYAHRCFVLTRAARQFFYHVQFDPGRPAPDNAACRLLVAKTVARNPRLRSAPDKQIIIPGYADLREFSAARAPLLKAECGGAWRSYVVRSHWRMVFAISREHQVATAAALRAALRQNVPPIIHIVKFPALTINHSLLVFAGTDTEFQCYDPNQPAQSISLSFDPKMRTFSLPRNHYWAGGPLDVIEIYRTWWM